MAKQWMIYGAYGYSGELIVEQALAKGMKPVVAGRNKERVEAVAKQFSLPSRVFSLDDPAAIQAGLDGMALVLNCAGPFSATAEPVIDAAISSGCHYLDITGEIDVFAAAEARADAARRADVVLLPGAGFDVVPTDCLAQQLAEALPAATELSLAFEAAGGPSPGTAKSTVEGMASGGRIRRDGQLTRVPLAWEERTIPFHHAKRRAVTIPWGDVFTAYISTGIPNIKVYMAMPPGAIKRMRRLRLIQPFLGLGVVQNWLKKRVNRSVRGPDAARRKEAINQLWGEAIAADGRRVSATMTTPNGYTLTATASVELVGAVLEKSVEGGYYTPSLLMGAGFADSLDGVETRMGTVEERSR